VYSVITFIRLINLIKLTSSYVLSVLFHKPIHWGSPAFVSIEPTNHCNLKCPECPTGQHGLTRETGSLTLKDFERYIEQVSPQAAFLTLYFQGEPYLHKDLFRFISYARSSHIHVMSSTNGHYLTEENIRMTIESGLNKLIISLDGTDQKAYEQYRIGGSFETVVNGIREFSRIRMEMKAQNPILEIQFLVLKSNEHQIEEIKKLGNSLGADRTVLKTAQFYDLSGENPLIPGEGRWSRYRRTSGQAKTSGQADKRTSGQAETSGQADRRTDGQGYELKKPLPNRCFRMWSGCVITWDGSVVPCCYDKDADHRIGDLNTQSFQGIWRGDNYRKFRKKILNERKSVDICRNCNQWW